MNFRLLLPALVMGCNPWPDYNTEYLDEDLWDANIVTLDDGVYARLPHAGQLVRVGTDDTWHPVDLDGARPTRMSADLYKNRLLVHAEWPICEDPEESIKLVEDCPEESLSWESELAIVDNGKRTAVANVPRHLNAMKFTPDGNTAVAYLNDDIDVGSVTGPIVDLSEVLFIDLDSGDTQSVSVGFMPKEVLFTQDGTRAVVLSRSKAVVIDIENRSVTIEYPLTNDSDIEIDPSAAVLSPDDRYAMIAIANQQDLYKLDLEVVSIDIEGLEGIPSDLASDVTYGQTVVVYGDENQVDIITEHDFIERVSLELDDPATSIAITDGAAVLYNTRHNSVRDVVLVDLNDMKSTEYVAANPVDSLQLTEEGDYAVAILRPENGGGSGLDGYQDARWGLAVMDLLSDDIASLVLESKPVGLEIVQNGDGAFALLLLEDLDSLLQIDLSRPGSYSEIELPAAPVGIDASPDGGFTIAHDSDLGQVSFLDPATGKIRTTGGFATAGMFSDDLLPRRDTE